MAFHEDLKPPEPSPWSSIFFILFYKEIPLIITNPSGINHQGFPLTTIKHPFTTIFSPHFPSTLILCSACLIVSDTRSPT